MEYIDATELIFRHLSQSKLQDVKPAPVADVKPLTLTRADVDGIIQRSRGASVEELEYAIGHAKDLILTDGERNQLGVSLSICAAQRARQMKGRRRDPNAEFISQTLKLPVTPHGLVDRDWVENLLRSNTVPLRDAETTVPHDVNVGPAPARSYGRRRAATARSHRKPG
jgi:hypothetical protein